MRDALNKNTVLVLNRNWQAIHTKTPAQAFCMMATDVATALDIEDGGSVRPVKWTEWLTLPVRADDNSVRTVPGAVRVPTVIVLANYAKVPQKRPKFSAKNIWQRDGATCQYTGRKLLPHEGNIDHVVPRSRSGKTVWENCVLAHREINSRKADRLPNANRDGWRGVRREVSDSALTFGQALPQSNSHENAIFTLYTFSYRALQPTRRRKYLITGSVREQMR